MAKVRECKNCGRKNTFNKSAQNELCEVCEQKTYKKKNSKSKSKK